VKKYLLLVAILFATLQATAQLGYNYYQFGIGTGINYVRASTSVQSPKNHLASDLTFTYNYSPYIPITAELQFGTLSGGGLPPNQDSLGRKYSNSYEALVVHVDYTLGEVIDYSTNDFLNVIKNFYFGSGVGVVFNNNTTQRISSVSTNGVPNYFPGKDNSTNLLIPLRLGYDFKIFNVYEQPSIAIDVGYVQNLLFGEGLDGYDSRKSNFQNSPTNQYRQFTISIKYFFGQSTAYHKLIRRF